MHRYNDKKTTEIREEEDWLQRLETIEKIQTPTEQK